MLEASAELRREPDLLVCDGYGLAHPRRFGLASHLGVLTGIPSIGVAKLAPRYRLPETTRRADALCRTALAAAR